MSQKKTKSSMNQLSEFKNLLLEPELERIESIEERLDNPNKFAGSIGEVLDKAVHKTKDKPRLARKLFPIVEESLYNSVQHNPQAMADAIYPVMAPAIRKAINDAMKQMSESVNQGVNNSLSSQGLKWRFQAIMSGQSYGDIVLKNTLIYRVQEVFLIHNDTGLLLAHENQSGEISENKELVSSMLTAIRDFVGDSLHVDQSQSLEMVEVGDVVVIVEKGPLASLACIVIGEPNTEIRKKMKVVLEEVHQDFGPELIGFKGDTAGFADVSVVIRRTLETQVKKDFGGGHSNKVFKIVLALLIILFVFIGFRTYWGIQWRSILKEIENQGGTVLSVNRTLTRYKATCIFDPVLVDLKDIIANSKFAGEKKSRKLRVENIEVQSNSRSAVIERLNMITKPEQNNITIYELNDTIYLAGQIPHQRYQQLIYWLPFFAGGEQLDFRDLVSNEMVDALMIKRNLESTVINFTSGSTKLTPGQEAKIAQINTWLIELNELLVVIDENWILEIVGSTDLSGTPESNLRLQNQRARYVLDALIQVQNSRIYTEWNPIDSNQKEKLNTIITKEDQWRNVSFKLNKILEK